MSVLAFLLIGAGIIMVYAGLTGSHIRDDIAMILRGGSPPKPTP
jgi:hypothetical protein